MLIHQVTDKFQLGGGLEHIYQLTAGIPEFRFTVFAESGDAVIKFANLKNVNTRPEGYNPALLTDPKPDLIHIHHLRPLWTMFRNPFASYDIPVLFTAHGMHIHKYEFMKGLRSKIKFKIRSSIERYLFNRTSGIIAVSQADADYIKSQYLIDNVKYITNGIDWTRVKETEYIRKDLETEYNLPVGGTIFVTAARFDFQKGHDVLIRAIGLIQDWLRARKVRFLLVGAGETLEAVKQLTAKLNLQDMVVFLGERTDIYRILKSADAMVLPSRWEGMPIVLLEAGLLKVPVIASRTWGNHELLADGRGILYENENSQDLAERIKQTISGDYELTALSEKLFETIQGEYSLEKMIKNLKKTYQKIISASK